MTCDQDGYILQRKIQDVRTNLTQKTKVVNKDYEVPTFIISNVHQE